MKALTAIVDWFGPYTLEDSREAAKFDYEDGVYMAIGKCKHERSSKLQYIGLATKLGARVGENHHALQQITRDREIWLGEIASPRTPGKKLKVTDSMLNLTEWAHAYFLQLPLNNKKTVNPPERQIVVYNRWWKTDYETQYQRRPHAEWPDLIDFYESDHPAKVIWFGQNQIVQYPAEFRS